MNWSHYIPYLCGMLVSLLCYALGVWTGRKITLDNIAREVAREKRRVEADRAEVRRLSIGRAAGLIDSDGQTIKLMTPSALRRLSDDELSLLATRRGIMTMQLMGDRGKIINAIEQHQRGITPEWLSLEDQ